MSVKLLAGLQAIDLEADLKGPDGKIIAAKGDRVVLLPQTYAAAIVMADGSNLKTAWQNMAAKVSQLALPPAVASQSANGLMSAADKIKLDGIDAKATATAAPPAAGNATPKAHGTAAAGTSAAYAREDHVHPSNDTNTHYTSHLYVGAVNGSANATTTNGNTYLIICDDSAVRDRRLIKGAGSVTVTSDASGNITITGTDTNTTYANMTAATASAAGKAGLVPAPAAGAQAKYLRGDGTWQTPPDTNTTYGVATQSANGLMTAADKKKLDGIDAGAQVNPSNYVTTNTAQTITVEKIFSASNALRLINGNYGAFFRNDGANFYLLCTAFGQAATGTWTSARPLILNLATGICTVNGNVPKTGDRGALAGSETASALTNSQTITATSPDCINLTTSGAVTLTFTPAAATVWAMKVLSITASAATTLTIKNAVWQNNGSAPTWGAAGKILVLVALFAGGRVILSVVDNTQ